MINIVQEEYSNLKWCFETKQHLALVEFAERIKGIFHVFIERGFSIKFIEEKCRISLDEVKRMQKISRTKIKEALQNEQNRRID